MLEICIQKDQRIPRRVVQSRSHRRLMSEVPGKAKQADMHPVTRRKAAELLSRPIGGAVIYKEELIIPAPLPERLAAAPHYLIKPFDPAFLIIGGDHETQPLHPLSSTSISLPLWLGSRFSSGGSCIYSP